MAAAPIALEFIGCLISPKNPEQMGSTNSLELQKGGWQAILDNFKRHVEA